MAFFDFYGSIPVDFGILMRPQVELGVEGGACAVRAEHRLKLNREFRRVFARGRSKATGRLVLYWWQKREGDFRVGFSVSKKVGNAVVRNRLKRQLRACLAQYQDILAEHSVDFVFVCRPAAARSSFADLNEDVVRLLRKGQFMV